MFLTNKQQQILNRLDEISDKVDDINFKLGVVLDAEHQVNHAKTKPRPEDFDLSEEDSVKMRKRYLRSKVKDLDIEIQGEFVEHLKIEDDRKWFIEWRIETLQKERDRFLRELHYLNNPDQDDDITLEQVKAIPIHDILKHYNIVITNGKFFKLRNERTPSAYIYYDSNSYWDFGASEGGSVIDLVMNIEKCTVGESIQKLKRFIY